MVLLLPLPAVAPTEEQAETADMMLLVALSKVWCRCNACRLRSIPVARGRAASGILTLAELASQPVELPDERREEGAVMSDKALETRCPEMMEEARRSSY